MEYYAIPIALDRIIGGQHLSEEVDVKEAIHQNIRMLLKSFSLTYRYDPAFGSALNKYHASTPPQGVPERVWRDGIRDDIQRNLKDMLSKYETRVEINDLFVDMRRGRGKNKSMVHVNVQISGNLTLGRKEKFHYPDSEVTAEAQEVFPLMIPVGRMK